jgi:hypothetical protein
MQIRKFVLGSVAALASMGSGFAVVGFTETFNANDGNWLTGASTPPTHFLTGGIDNSGYISYTVSFTSASGGPFGSPPSTILFRANEANNASDGAFVGDWLGSGVITFSIAVRHYYETDLTFYARFAASSPPGAGASIAPELQFTVTPDTWTVITVPIVNDNPPFLSYGTGTFDGIFSDVQNLQVGFYLPPNTEFTDFRMDIDNASIAVVPEPATVILGGLGLGILALRRRR